MNAPAIIAPPALTDSQLDLERFAWVRGYEGMYEVSSIGAVLSLARVSVSGKRQTIRSRVISPSSNGAGYKKVQLWRDGKATSHYVHRLVLEAFSGIAGPGLEACHNNGNRSQNVISNLRWDTKKNNHADKFAHGTVRNGEMARAAKLTAQQVIEIRSRLLAGDEQQAIAEHFSITQPTVSDIKSRRTWKHI